MCWRDCQIPRSWESVFLTVTGEINSLKRAHRQAANSAFAFSSLVTNETRCQNALFWFGKVNCSNYIGTQKCILEFEEKSRCQGQNLSFRDDGVCVTLQGLALRTALSRDECVT